MKAAIRHLDTPRVPYNIRPDGAMQEKLREYLGLPSEPEPLSLGRLDLNDLFFDNDVEMIHLPWWAWGPLAPEWRGPEPPTGPALARGTGSYTTFYDELKAHRERTDRYILATIYGSHFEKAHAARGFEAFMMDIGASYSFAKQLLTTIVDRNMVMLENVLACEEIDGVLLGSDWGSQRGLLMSPAMWDDLIRPGEQREYDLVHAYDKDVWVHSCGKVDELIPRLVDMGLDVLNPLQPECMDVARIKRDHGDSLAFWGGVSTQQLLPFGTPDDVRSEARRFRDMMSHQGGLIFAPAQDLQPDVPMANVHALLEVAREGRT